MVQLHAPGEICSTCSGECSAKLNFMQMSLSVMCNIGQSGSSLNARHLIKFKPGGCYNEHSVCLWAWRGGHMRKSEQVLVGVALRC